MDNLNKLSIVEDDKENQNSGFKLVFNSNSITALLSLKNYIIDTKQYIDKLQNNFENNGNSYLHLLKYDYKIRINNLKTATMRNFNFLLNFISYYGLDLDSIFSDDLFLNQINYFKYNQQVFELRNVMKDVAIDWSKEHQCGRRECFKHIISDLNKYFKINMNEINVLIMSSGAGRLAYEIAKSGYLVSVIENSFLKCIFLDFIFNKTSKIEEYEIQPFIFSFSNLLDEASPFKIFKIPDVCPKSVLSRTIPIKYYNSIDEFDEFSKFDTIVTFFTINRSINILEAVMHIYKVLKKGGIWLNYGPLLYDFIKDEECPQIAFSWENLKHFISNIGFTILKEEIHTCPFSDNNFTLLSQIFKAIHTVAKKN